MQLVLILAIALWSSSAVAFQCPEPTGHFADPSNPHKFFECANGQAYEFSCPDPLVFDPITINCNYTLDVITTPTTPRPLVTTASQTQSSITVTTPITSTTARHIPNFKCPELNGHFSDPTNPHKFYECANGEPYEFSCPEPLVFDNTIKNCVYSSDNTTSAPNTTTPASTTTIGTTRTSTPASQTTNSVPATTVTTARTIVFVCPEPSGHFVDPKNPHKFYECANGQAYEFSCPEPLVFDMSIKNCNYAADNNTPAPNITTTTKDPTVTTPSFTETPTLITVRSTQTAGLSTVGTNTTPVTTIHPTGPPVTVGTQTETPRVRHTDSLF